MIPSLARKDGPATDTMFAPKSGRMELFRATTSITIIYVCLMAVRRSNMIPSYVMYNDCASMFYTSLGF